MGTLTVTGDVLLGATRTEPATGVALLPGTLVVAVIDGCCVPRRGEAEST